jgi:hypothetical protein
MMMNKRFLLGVIAALVFPGINVLAQGDNSDSGSGSHALNLVVPEIALLDVWDMNTGTEAGTINMTVEQTDSDKMEAGLYDLSSATYSGIYLNYSSVVGAGDPNFDNSRNIVVQMMPGSTFPESFDLRITPSSPVIEADGGTPASAGTVIPQGVALGRTTPIGTDATLVTNIGSVYTGDQQNGVALTYSLEHNGNFSEKQSGFYTATLQYTLTDF